MTNQVAVDFIAAQEGFSPKSFWDQNGWACGYGLHGPDIGPNTVMTEFDAMARLTSRVNDTETQIRAIVTATLTVNQWAAIISFAYNCGVNAFAASHLRIFINQGQMALAVSQFGLWIHAGGVVNDGLVKRRAAEAALFSTP